MKVLIERGVLGHLYSVLYVHRVVVLDEQEKPIPGFKATMEHADGLELPVAFGRGACLLALADRAVKLRFEMKNAKVFGFKCK